MVDLVNNDAGFSVRLPLSLMTSKQPKHPQSNFCLHLYVYINKT
jgi:hypothetical protein